MTPLTVAQVRRRYLFLHGLRWLPVGLIIPVAILLLLERGLTLSQVGIVAAVQGVAVLILEVPTGGMADALGRRPVLLLASVVNLASLILFAVADDLLLFLLFAALQGIFRALDSGPLDAWYVDAVLDADPKARIENGLSGAGVVLSAAIAIGALGSSGLVALHPWSAVSALTLPVLVAAVLQVVGIIAIAALMKEAPPQHGGPDVRTLRSAAVLRGSIASVPAVIRGALGLLRRSRILLALLVAELMWAVGSVTFEALMPPRLAETVGNGETAAAMMGPAGTAAWLASALGAGLAPVLSRFTGVPLAAALMRVTQGATVIGMGILAGPVGVIAAFVGTYLIHGAANPLHQTLLHRQVDGPYRATVLSLNSMTGRIGLVSGSIALTALADASSISAAIVVGAVVMAAAAPLYLPARRTSHPSAATSQPTPTIGAGEPQGR